MIEKVEKEYKFLIENIYDIPLAKFKSYSIYQIYLDNEDNNSERIRSIEDLDTNEIEYYHTIKVPLKEGSLEKERLISLKDFSSLKNKARKNSYPIHKLRRIFEYKGLKFEIDNFSFPIAFSMLEIEVDSFEEKVKIPTFINVIEDVTFVKEFSNSAISKKPENTNRKICKFFSKAKINYQK